MGEVENRSARLDMLEAQARILLRTVGPASIMPESFALKKCPQCTPPPKLYKCMLCDWTTPDKWRYVMHVDLNPKWCREWAAKKERAWAAKA